MTWVELAVPGAAAMAAGFVNALAGGGTLVSFPALMAVGVPPVAANVTNTVALCPGYLGATLAQRRDLHGQGRRLWFLLPAGALGGVGGAILLLVTGERLFRSLVPFLILLASALLAAQDPIRQWLLRRLDGTTGAVSSTVAATIPVGAAAVYGGYFGAGLSVIVLASLGLLLQDTLTRLNALKQAVALAVNVAAAVVFAGSGQVVWPAAAIMAVGALAGGAVGGRVAAAVNAAVLRRLVVGLGVAVALIYFVP